MSCRPTSWATATAAISCCFPADSTECFEFGSPSFDLAERLQTPVFVLSDLDLGMNMWTTEPFEYPEQPLDRGKVLSAED